MPLLIVEKTQTHYKIGYMYTVTQYNIIQLHRCTAIKRISQYLSWCKFSCKNVSVIRFDAELSLVASLSQIVGVGHDWLEKVVITWSSRYVITRAYFKKNLVRYCTMMSWVLEGTMASAEREPITGVITRVWGEWVEFNVPPDTIHVISEAERRSGSGAPTAAGSRGRAPGQGGKPPAASDIFILKVHFLRSSCGILHWCNGCTVHQFANLASKWPTPV